MLTRPSRMSQPPVSFSMPMKSRWNRTCASHSSCPSFRTDEFILKITVPKVTENDDKVTEKVTVNDGKVTESELNRAENDVKTAKNVDRLIEKIHTNGGKISENRIAILRLMEENPYITKVEMAKAVGISEISVWRNIEAMRGKYLRRVGPDKGGSGKCYIKNGCRESWQ